MARRSLTVEEVLALLAAAPGRIAAAAAPLSARQLRTPPAAGEWSVTGVLAHLRACADVWGGAIATILAADAPVLRAIDPRRFMERTDYPNAAFAASFAAYAGQRGELLARLDRLEFDGWWRAATVTGAGRPLERTVHFYAQWLARHERTHLAQIEATARAVGA